MSAKPDRWSLLHAALNGAVVGPLVIVLNLYFQGQLAAKPVLDIVMMLLGGAGGGAVLFLAIAFFARSLTRRMR